MGRDGGPSWRRRAGRMASSRDLDAPLNWRCGSPVCCLLRSAGCCCVWCDGWTGCHHHWRAGKYFQEQRTARHTHLAHHRRQFHRSAFLSRLLSRWHPARSWSPSLCHRTVAAVWATGPFIKAAGTLDRSSLGKRRWRRRISPECGCHCDDGISPGTDPEERALPAGWRRRREKNPPNLFLSPSLPLTGLTGRGGRRPIGGTDDVPCGPWVLDRRQPQSGQGHSHPSMAPLSPWIPEEKGRKKYAHEEPWAL